MAEFTTTLELTAPTCQSVAKGRKEIEEIIAFRKSGKPAMIATQIKDLDSSNFEIREKATRELRTFGDWALPQLRKALENPASREARGRIEQVIEQITNPASKESPPE